MLFRSLKLSLNLSAQTVSNDEAVKKILSMVSASGIPNNQIGFEVTESDVIAFADETTARLESIHNQGYKIIIDDFGVDYSSLGRLSRLPISILKIDAVFVKNMLQSEKDKKIVRSIINLANDLDMDTVAEGVETKEQLEFLMNNGCHVIQGFLLGRPVSADVIVKTLLESPEE